jgi:hypothetical protein
VGCWEAWNQTRPVSFYGLQASLRGWQVPFAFLAVHVIMSGDIGGSYIEALLASFVWGVAWHAYNRL